MRLINARRRAFAHDEAPLAPGGRRRDRSIPLSPVAAGERSSLSCRQLGIHRRIATQRPRSPSPGGCCPACLCQERSLRSDPLRGVGCDEAPAPECVRGLRPPHCSCRVADPVPRTCGCIRPAIGADGSLPCVGAQAAHVWLVRGYCLLASINLCYRAPCGLPLSLNPNAIEQEARCVCCVTTGRTRASEWVEFPLDGLGWAVIRPHNKS